MKVAIVHYWLVNMRGGERVIEALLEIYPHADIFCHVVDPESVSPNILSRIKGTTFINRLPLSKRLYQSYLPLMPLALEQLDLTSYDLIISSESGPSKGIIPGPDAIHICYCHSPMRYVWDMYYEYRSKSSFLKRLLMPLLIHYLKMWDFSTAYRVKHFIANSNYVSKRILNYYGRKSTVIQPPVDFSAFTCSEEKDDYYLLVGQLVDYKRADIAINAFNSNGKKLVIIGEGEKLKHYRRIANPNITLLGKQSFQELKKHYSRCRALIFPGIEDFGIVPLEAMASGRPVIAFAKGGALETVVNGETGILFHEQTAQSLNQAIEHFESTNDTFDPEKIRNHAIKFDVHNFKINLKDFIDKALA
ncbi:glycosyltransferase [Ketobacter alkanivorans]|uniref:Glycosyl transferase n=1 Tax=Ketobacter alkanivorans TaxID=1917421 RepID=A0A2K9LQI9_9GAMM|nr:glycosyltransferase [Ketobacter alkanivorans]AUM13745.1 glycosyl transferase [Ketobacter alkanivorans]